jgi:hypothetical protein
VHRSVKNFNYATIAFDIAFVDDNNGISPIAINGQGAWVQSTTDGGATWQQQPGPAGVLSFPVFPNCTVPRDSALPCRSLTDMSAAVCLNAAGFFMGGDAMGNTAVVASILGLAYSTTPGGGEPTLSSVVRSCFGRLLIPIPVVVARLQVCTTSLIRRRPRPRSASPARFVHRLAIMLRV